MSRLKNRSVVLILSLIAGESFAGPYTTFCDVEDGFATASVETDDARVDFEGKVKIRLYDKWGHNVGKVKSSVDTSIGSDSKRSIATEPVEWFVTSCTLDLEGTEISVEHVRYERPVEVVVERPGIVIEPKVVIGFPFPSLFPHSSTVVQTSIHGSSCEHSEREIEVIQSYEPRRRTVVVNRQYGYPQQSYPQQSYPQQRGYPQQQGPVWKDNRREIPSAHFSDRPPQSRIVTVHHRSL